LIFGLSVGAMVHVALAAPKEYAKMQIQDKVASEINSNYYYERMFDPNNGVVCYSLITGHEGVSVSCVKN